MPPSLKSIRESSTSLSILEEEDIPVELDMNNIPIISIPRRKGETPDTIPVLGMTKSRSSRRQRCKKDSNKTRSESDLYGRKTMNFNAPSMVNQETLSNFSVIKTGIIFTKSQSSFFFRPTWKLRYCVLTCSKLKFYANENGDLKEEIGISQFNESSLEVMPHDAQFSGKNATMWRFSLRIGKRRFVFSALSGADLKTWVNSFETAFSIAKKKESGRLTDIQLSLDNLASEESRENSRSCPNLLARSKLASSF